MGCAEQVTFPFGRPPINRDRKYPFSVMITTHIITVVTNTVMVPIAGEIVAAAKLIPEPTNGNKQIVMVTSKNKISRFEFLYILGTDLNAIDVITIHINKPI
jgi:hypothetical protein